MATSSLALKRLVSPTLLSGSRLPVILSAASRLFSTRAYDPFYDVYGATKISHAELQVSRHKQIADFAEITRYAKHKNTDDAVHLRLLMPGLAKEDAKVYIDKDKLIAEGVKEKDFEDDKNDVMLRITIQLPIHRVKADAITTEMKNGLLKVCVPMIDAQKFAFKTFK